MFFCESKKTIAQCAKYIFHKCFFYHTRYFAKCVMYVLRDDQHVWYRWSIEMSPRCLGVASMRKRETTNVGHTHTQHGGLPEAIFMISGRSAGTYLFFFLLFFFLCEIKFLAPASVLHNHARHFDAINCGYSTVRLMRQPIKIHWHTAACNDPSSRYSSLKSRHSESASVKCSFSFILTNKKKNN